MILVKGVNGPLQERTNVLQLDLQRANEISDNNFPLTLNQRNFYYQTQLANEIIEKVNKTLLLLTLALNNHFNLDQKYLVNTSKQVYVLYEKLSKKLLSNKTIKYNEQQFQINFPENISFDLNENFLLQTRFERLAPYGNYQSNTNLSRAITISLYNQNGNLIQMKIL